MNKLMKKFKSFLLGESSEEKSALDGVLEEWSRAVAAKHSGHSMQPDCLVRELKLDDVLSGWAADVAKKHPVYEVYEMEQEEIRKEEEKKKRIRKFSSESMIFNELNLYRGDWERWSRGRTSLDY